MLTTTEAGAILRTTRATVCLYAQLRWLKASRVGRHLLIDRGSVLRLLERGTPTTAPGKKRARRHA